MKTNLRIVATCLAMGVGTAVWAQEAAIGKAAPEFRLADTTGKDVDLSALKGKFVVLEWTNPDCPFVRKHYDSGNMQKLQRQYTAKGVVWLTINSSAPGKQGNYPPEKWNSIIKERNSAATAVLLDPDGKVGRLYGAKTTPHLFVISPAGILLYMGAIDDKPTFAVEDVATAVNYLQLALDAAMAGKPVATPVTQPYGCGVKY
jgi:peroxiredoxin